MSLVGYENRGSAVLLTMNRAERRNALSRTLIADLDGALTRAEGDPLCRCVLLGAAGPVFCAGMDLAELQESLHTPAEDSPVWEDALRLAGLYDRIYSFPRPTIALVQGPAVAGGAGLVTVCDLALATPAARFGYPEVRRGLVAAMVMPHLLRHVGERAARWLLLTGETIDAENARQCGLINEVVPEGELTRRGLAVAAACAAGGPQALATTKAFLRRFSKQALSLEEAAEGSAAPRLTEECRHGLEAFFAKKPAPWEQG